MKINSQTKNLKFPIQNQQKTDTQTKSFDYSKQQTTKSTHRTNSTSSTRQKPSENECNNEYYQTSNVKGQDPYRPNFPHFDSCIEEVSREYDDEWSEQYQRSQGQSQLGGKDLNIFQPKSVFKLKQQQEPTDDQFDYCPQTSNTQDSRSSSIITDASKSSYIQPTNLTQDQTLSNSQQIYNDQYSSAKSNGSINIFSMQSCTNKSAGRSELSEQKKALYLKLRGANGASVSSTACQSVRQNENGQENVLKENTYINNEQNPQRNIRESDPRSSINKSKHNNSVHSEQSQGNQSINTEIEKWKKFGYLMAESYDELKKEHEKVLQDKDKDKKIIQAMKDQIIKLKQLLQAKNIDDSMVDIDQREVIDQLREENTRLKQIQKEKDSLEQEVKFQGEIVSQLNEKLQKAKQEIKTLQVQISKNQQQQIQLQKQQQSNQKNPYQSRNECSIQSNEQLSFYKKMSHQHLRECSQLADELICLRSDMDKSANLSNTLRASSNSINHERRRSNSYSKNASSVGNQWGPESVREPYRSRITNSALKSEQNFQQRNSMISNNSINTPSQMRGRILFVNGQTSLPLSPNPISHGISRQYSISKNPDSHDTFTNHLSPNNLNPLISTDKRQRESSQTKQSIKVNKIFKDEDNQYYEKSQKSQIQYMENLQKDKDTSRQSSLVGGDFIYGRIGETMQNSKISSIKNDSYSIQTDEPLQALGEPEIVRQDQQTKIINDYEYFLDSNSSKEQQLTGQTGNVSMTSQASCMLEKNIHNIQKQNRPKNKNIFH